jgi:hypothetical protein
MRRASTIRGRLNGWRCPRFSVIFSHLASIVIASLGILADEAAIDRHEVIFKGLTLNRIHDRKMYEGDGGSRDRVFRIVCQAGLRVALLQWFRCVTNRFDRCDCPLRAYRRGKKSLGSSIGESGWLSDGPIHGQSLSRKERVAAMRRSWRICVLACRNERTFRASSAERSPNTYYCRRGTGRASSSTKREASLTLSPTLVNDGSQTAAKQVLCH